MVARLKNINPVQLALVNAVVYGMVGLLIAVLMLPFSAMMAAMHTPMAGFGMGVFGIIIFPIIYGALGFVGGLVVALFYNIAAGWTGGAEITLDSTARAAVPSSQYSA